MIQCIAAKQRGSRCSSSNSSSSGSGSSSSSSSSSIIAVVVVSARQRADLKQIVGTDKTCI